MKKMRAKEIRELNRAAGKNALREVFPRVLIVTEGSKTEPNYFKKLRSFYRLRTASIEICGDSGSAPISVVEHAEKLYKESRKGGNTYNKVYCVFDKDGHESFEEAMNICRDKKDFCAITSAPCFEYWILLHYKDTARSFANCQEVESAVKYHIQNYEKGNEKCIECLISEEILKKAICNAIRNRQVAENDKRKSPMTNVDELVKYLQDLSVRR